MVSPKKTAIILSKLASKYGADKVAIAYKKYQEKINNKTLYLKVIKALENIEAKETKNDKAMVATAFEHDEASKKELVALIGAELKNTEFLVEKNILGGFVARFGNKIFDGSILGNIGRLREKLLTNLK